jgi:MFS family permease
MALSLRSTQYLGFTTLGLAMSLTGPLIPTILTQIPMNYLQAGMVLSGQFLGMLPSVPFGGYLADRFGKKRFLIASGMLFTVGLVGLACAGSFATLLASCVLCGIGGGGYEVGINALQADRAEVEAGKAMNFLHFFYGVGAIAGPLLATAALKTDYGWRLAFAVGAVLPLLVSGVLLAQKVPRASSPTPGASAAARVYSSGTLWLFGGVLVLYVGIETSLFGWIATFWAQLPSHGVLAASLTASIFWGTLTAGRLLCGKLADRIGLVRYILAAATATLMVSGVWALFPNASVTLAAVFLFGICLAGIYPTAIAFVTGLFPADSGKVVGFMTVFSAIGGFVLPSLLGWTADMFGIESFPLFVTILAALMLGAVNAHRAVRRLSPSKST